MDELIDALRKSACVSTTWGDLLGVAADAIEELISRLPKWISVNEKLPDSQRPVLVYVPESEGFCEYVGMADYTWSPKGGFWCGTDGETYGAIGFIRTPTHWRELPEPPKGELVCTKSYRFDYGDFS